MTNINAVNFKSMYTNKVIITNVEGRFYDDVRQVVILGQNVSGSYTDEYGLLAIELDQFKAFVDMLNSAYQQAQTVTPTYSAGYAKRKAREAKKPSPVTTYTVPVQQAAQNPQVNPDMAAMFQQFMAFMQAAQPTPQTPVQTPPQTPTQTPLQPSPVDDLLSAMTPAQLARATRRGGKK